LVEVRREYEVTVLRELKDAVSHRNVKILLVMDERSAHHIERESQSWKSLGVEWHVDWHQEAEVDAYGWTELKKVRTLKFGYDATKVGSNRWKEGPWTALAIPSTGCCGSQCVVSNLLRGSVTFRWYLTSLRA
jgi:hypothetical protein